MYKNYNIKQMAKPKHLFLTCVSTVLNEKGEETLKRASEGQDYNEDNPPEGSKAWFDKLGIRPPKDLEENIPEIDEDGNIELGEDEVDLVYNDILLERSEFGCAIDNIIAGTSTVYTKSNLQLTVIESTDEIYDQIYLIDSSWLERMWVELKWRFRNKKKDLVLEKENNN